MTIHWHFEKSSPQTVRTGESNQSAGSHMRDAIQTRNSNVLQFLPRALAPSNLPDSTPVFYSRKIAPLETPYPFQAGIDVGVALFWIGYLSLVGVGLGFACWAVAIAVLRSIGL